MLWLNLSICFKWMLLLKVSMSLETLKVFLLGLLKLSLILFELSQGLTLETSVKVFPAMQVRIDSLVTHLDRSLYPIIAHISRAIVHHVEVFSFADNWFVIIKIFLPF